MINQEIAAIFRDIATILEIKGDNVFRIRAFARAAQNIEGLAEDLKVVLSEGRLEEIPGIGKDLSSKIKEFAATGHIKFYEDLRESIPEGLLDLLNIPSVGPKTAKLLYEKLRIKNISDLERAIVKGNLLGLPGIKEKAIDNIRKGIALVKTAQGKMMLSEAIDVGQDFVSALKKIPEVKKISVGGSLRRQKDSIRDVDILITSSAPKAVMGVFVKLPQVTDVLAHGATKSSVRTEKGAQVDCRVVEEKSYGAALLYFTGSKNFNIRLRHIAAHKGMKLNEYGLYKGERLLSSKTEEEVLKTLGLEFIEPELREDNGEVELAAKDDLPKLIKLSDIRGDLHVHSTWSDGNNSLSEMAQVCRKKGYSYMASTDHSQGLKIAKGLNIARLEKKRKDIELINEGYKDFRVFFGTEVDIDSDGNLDYPDEILRSFDIVVAAIHAGFKQSRVQLTKRLIKACKNKYVHIIAHPSGRLWGVREPYDFDIEEVLKAAQDTNTSLEINSFPQRLDLNDLHCRMAKQKKVKITVNTDSHRLEHLDFMSLGVAVARRGWLEKEDVLNTLPIVGLLKAIKK